MSGPDSRFNLEPDIPKNRIRVFHEENLRKDDPLARSPRERRMAAMTGDELRLLQADRSDFGPEEIRHRFGYHTPANLGVQEMHIATRGLFMDFASVFDRMLPSGRAKSTFMTKLEEACMWANKAIAEMSPVVDE